MNQQEFDKMVARTVSFQTDLFLISMEQMKIWLETDDFGKNEDQRFHNVAKHTLCAVLNTWININFSLNKDITQEEAKKTMDTFFGPVYRLSEILRENEKKES
jgi:hypothetical protein